MLKDLDKFLILMKNQSRDLIKTVTALKFGHDDLNHPVSITFMNKVNDFSMDDVMYKFSKNDAAFDQNIMEISNNWKSKILKQNLINLDRISTKLMEKTNINADLIKPQIDLNFSNVYPLINVVNSKAFTLTEEYNNLIPENLKRVKGKICIVINKRFEYIQCFVEYDSDSDKWVETSIEDSAFVVAVAHGTSNHKYNDLIPLHTDNFCHYYNNLGIAIPTYSIFNSLRDNPKGAVIIQGDRVGLGKYVMEKTKLPCSPIVYEDNNINHLSYSLFKTILNNYKVEGNLLFQWISTPDSVKKVQIGTLLNPDKSINELRFFQNLQLCVKKAETIDIVDLSKYQRVSVKEVKKGDGRFFIKDTNNNYFYNFKNLLEGWYPLGPYW